MNTMKESFFNKPIKPDVAGENYSLENPDPKTLNACLEEIKEAKKDFFFEEQWENPKQVKVLGSGKYGLQSEFFDVYDIKSEKPKTEVPLVIGLGWGEIPESGKKHIKYWTEHGRRVVVPDTPHGISAEKKKDLPAIEIEKMTALYETLRASGIYMKEDGTATGQVDLMGRSEGAIFSVLLAYFYPKLVRNLVLENPAGLAGKTNKGIFTMRWLGQMKQDILKEYKENGSQPEDHLSEVLNRNLPKAIESVLAISDTDIREMLKEIKANGIGVSVITTTEDRFFPPGKILSGLTEKHINKGNVEDGTHNSYFWEPERFAKLIDENLDGLEEQKRQQEKEDAEELADHFKMHPEQLNPPADSEEAGPEVAEFKNMVASFESTHSLIELHSIVNLTPELYSLFRYTNDMSPEQVEAALKNLTPEDARNYKKRIAARRDIIPIVTKLNTFKGNKREELKAEYMRLSKAIGVIGKDNKIDHDR